MFVVDKKQNGNSLYKYTTNSYNTNDIGNFPERLKVYFVYPEIDFSKNFSFYDILKGDIEKY